MLPGAPKHAELKQLSLAHTKLGSKEEAFIREVMNIGEILPISVEKIWLEHLGKYHDCVPIRAVAKYILENHPEKLLPRQGFQRHNPSIWPFQWVNPFLAENCTLI